MALEESNRRTALGLMSSATKQSLHIGEHDRATLTKAYQDSIANWNLFLFDGFGSFDPDVIYNRIEYLATRLEVRVVFLDHLSILLSGLDGDERRMLDITMTRLRSLVERTGIALFLVSHLRRTSHRRRPDLFSSNIVPPVIDICCDVQFRLPLSFLLVLLLACLARLGICASVLF